MKKSREPRFLATNISHRLRIFYAALADEISKREGRTVTVEELHQRLYPNIKRKKKR